MKSLAFAFLLFAFAPFASAQQSAPVVTTTDASPPASARQFDFLLGAWELDVHPKVSSLAAMIHGTPTLVGTWKAWRAPNGLGIEDEMHVVDTSGNPISLSRASRTWSVEEARWKISSVDAYHDRKSESTGILENGVMRLNGHFDDADGKTILTRTRYFDIGADAFHMQQDRSDDNGQSWDEGVLTIDARRTAATATP